MDSPDETSSSDLDVELVVKENFNLDPGIYQEPLEFLFEPRYGASRP